MEFLCEDLMGHLMAVAAPESQKGSLELESKFSVSRGYYYYKKVLSVFFLRLLNISECILFFKFSTASQFTKLPFERYPVSMIPKIVRRTRLSST